MIMSHPQTTQTQKRNNIVASFAVITMIILMIAGIKAIVTEPRTITNSRVVIMPNDSVIALREEIAVLRDQNTILNTVAADRLQIIYNISGPMGVVTDSLVALARLSKSVLDSNKIATDR